MERQSSRLGAQKYLIKDKFDSTNIRCTKNLRSRACRPQRKAPFSDSRRGRPYLAILSESTIGSEYTVA